MQRNPRNRYLLLLDAALIGFAPILAYALRFEGWDWSAEQVTTAVTFTAIAVPLSLITFYCFGLYRRLWRYASIAEVELIFAAAATASALCWIVGFWVLPVTHLTPERVPVLVLFSTSLLFFAIVGTPRLLMRVAGWRSVRRQMKTDRRIIIAGAGAAGESIVRELRANPELGMLPIGFVDDDLQKHGMRLGGIPVLGPLNMLSTLITREGATDILIAMPRAPGKVVREVLRTAYDAGARTQIVPGLFEILSERVSVTTIREVQIEDLLRREAVQTDLRAVEHMVANRTVLVTGAGGSIGSELCRQLAPLRPETLVVLGHGENPIFDLTEELSRRGVACRVVPVIADVRHRQRMHQVFAEHRPVAVFHAAAHKHVPMMECNVIEAVSNNIMGTRNVVEAAVAHGAEHFVLISTDKVVRPTNVMGASKRIAEFIVHNAAIKHGRNFVSVRFGNVLGSQGSVVPTFTRQIREGGPITVTHHEMRRFFMTIPEAVQLVLQAGALGMGGELFMLDMGEPVRVLDLARDMIRLSGLEEGVDIEIEFTGIRPGEKLYEEMFFSHEVAEPTSHAKILRARTGVEQYCSDEEISVLIEESREGADETRLRFLLRSLVPDFADRLALVHGQGRDVRRTSGAVSTADLGLAPEKKRRASGQHQRAD